MEIPVEGFLKTTRPKTPALPSDLKVQLIRKGNELFSRGEFEQAKKIFVSTLYTDGMVRMGDYYVKNKDYLSAFQMYKLAPAAPQAEAMMVKLTTVLRNWLSP